MSAGQKELYVAVDIEADGPIPGPYSMLSLGMAVVGRPNLTFYTELRPISDQFVPKALAVCGLDRDRLKESAPDAHRAMASAAEWVDRVGQHGKPIFVAAPAVFDGMFVHWYFMRFLGRNPFAVNGAGVDIRSYWMGAQKVTWRETGRETIQKFLGVQLPPHTHNALDDARELAALFEAVLVSCGKIDQ